MNSKHFFLVLGGIGIWYLTPVYALKRLRFSLSNFSIINYIFYNFLDFGINLHILNPTAVNLTVNSLYCDVYINNEWVSGFTYTGDLKLPAHGANILPAVIRIEKTKITETIWNNIILNNFRNSTITLSGSLIANKKPYPLKTSLNL